MFYGVLSLVAVLWFLSFRTFALGVLVVYTELQILLLVFRVYTTPCIVLLGPVLCFLYSQLNKNLLFQKKKTHFGLN